MPTRQLSSSRETYDELALAHSEESYARFNAKLVRVEPLVINDLRRHRWPILSYRRAIRTQVQPG